MRSTATVIVVAICAVTAAPAIAATYRWVDQHGVVNYSDTPPPGAERPDGQPSTPPPTMREPEAEDSPAPPPPSQRSAARAMPSRAVQELMERMHFRHDADQAARYARQVVFSQLARTRNPAAAWSAVNVAFSSEALIAAGGEQAARALGDSEMLPRMLAWLRSPLGRKMMDLGAEPDTPASEAEFRKFAVGLPEAFSAERIRLVRDFGRASDFAALSLDMTTAIEDAVMDLVAHWRRDRRPQSANRARAVTAASVDDLARWRVQLGILFVYREVSDADLREALEFWRSPVGQTLARGYRQTLLGAIATAHAYAAGIAPARVREARRPDGAPRP